MTSIHRYGLTFTYYPQSRGVIVTDHLRPVDAGPIRYTGTLPTEQDFERWAAIWFLSDTLRARKLTERELRRRKGRKQPKGKNNGSPTGSDTEH